MSYSMRKLRSLAKKKRQEAKFLAFTSDETEPDTFNIDLMLDLQETVTRQFTDAIANDKESKTK